MTVNYTYSKRSFEWEDSEYLQPYNVNSNVKKYEEKNYLMYKSVEYLDVWTDHNFKIKDRNTILFFNMLDMEILSMLERFILMYEETRLKRATEAAKAVERYFRLCWLCGLDKQPFQEHIFRTAADILFEAKVESPQLFGKLFKLMCRNEDILDYVMNYLHLDHLIIFLKQLRLGGLYIKKIFPLCGLYVDASSDRIFVFLQYINSFRSDSRYVADYVRELYAKPLKKVIPRHYSVKRFDLLHFTFAHSGTVDDATLILAKTLVWRSVPHAYLTINEVINIFKKLTSSPEEHRHFQRTLENYYQILIFPTMRPRSLKHYARIAFRKFYRIPEAIDNSSLPENIKSYLKLLE